jgi:hypothetical protein
LFWNCTLGPGRSIYVKKHPLQSNFSEKNLKMESSPAIDFMRHLERWMLHSCDSGTRPMSRKVEDSDRPSAPPRERSKSVPEGNLQTHPHHERPKSQEMHSKDHSAPSLQRVSEASASRGSNFSPKAGARIRSPSWHSGFDARPQAMASEFEQRVAATRTMEVRMALQRRKLTVYELAQPKKDQQVQVSFP